MSTRYAGGTDTGGRIVDRVTTERLGDVVARQQVVPAYLQELVDRLGLDALVTVTSKHTPFGTYLLGVEEA